MTERPDRIDNPLPQAREPSPLSDTRVAQNEPDSLFAGAGEGADGQG